MRKSSVALLAVVAALAACSTYDDGYGRGGYQYSGSDYDRLGNDCGTFGGSGGELLDPWLACTGEGEDLVHAKFDRDHDGRIGRKTADRANVWFRRHADTDRNMRLTDPEIKAALVTHVRHAGRYGR